MKSKQEKFDHDMANVISKAIKKYKNKGIPSPNLDSGRVRLTQKLNKWIPEIHNTAWNNKTIIKIKVKKRKL